MSADAVLMEPLRVYRGLAGSTAVARVGPALAVPGPTMPPPPAGAGARPRFAPGPALRPSVVIWMPAFWSVVAAAVPAPLAPKTRKVAAAVIRPAAMAT